MDCKSSSRLSCPALARRIVMAATVTVCVLAACEAMACPNCKDAVNTSDPEGLNVARGYFYSILIMLAMPCTLISSFGIYVWREMQRQKRAGPTAVEQAIGGSPVTGMPDHPSSEPIPR